MGAAYCTTFDAELARLKQAGRSQNGAPPRTPGHPTKYPITAAYAGWRLAVCLLDRGRRNDGQSELVAAYAAAQHHEPLRREIEALARRARLTLEAAPKQADPSAAAASGGTTPNDLTPRELDVLRLLGTGASNDEIGSGST